MFWKSRTELLHSKESNTPNQQGVTTFVGYILLIAIISIFVTQIIFNSHKLFFSAVIGYYFTSN